jgi:hypothetical protein
MSETGPAESRRASVFPEQSSANASVSCEGPSPCRRSKRSRDNFVALASGDELIEALRREWHVDLQAAALLIENYQDF